MLRVAWVYFKLMVCIMVIINLVLLTNAMLNQVPGFRASHNHPRFEVGSTSQVRNSPETPATQPDLGTILSDPQVHARSRVGLKQIESLQPVIEGQSCSICLNPASPSAHIKTLACGHEVSLQILFLYRLRLFPTQD